MALPADLKLATLTGRLLDGTSGDPMDIVVKIEPQFQMLQDLPGGSDSGDTGSVVYGFPTITIDTTTTVTGDGSVWSYTTAANGTFSFKLIGYSDEQILNPTKFDYKISVYRKGVGGADDTLLYTTGLSAQEGTTTDLSTLPPNFKSTPAKYAVTINAGGGGGVSSWTELQDKPAVIAAGATQADARAAISAGTSNLTIGTTATTAKAGDYQPTPAEIGAATAAQGANADSAIQPGDLATVATTGAFGDLINPPTIPTTAGDIGAVPNTRKVNGKELSADVTLGAGDVGAATAAQGAKADTALQPGGLALVATSNNYTDLPGLSTALDGKVGQAATNPIRERGYGDTFPADGAEGDAFYYLGSA